MEFYCVKCREKVETSKNLVPRVYTTSKGMRVYMTCGNCPQCESKVCKIIDSVKVGSN